MDTDTGVDVHPAVTPSQNLRDVVVQATVIEPGRDVHIELTYTSEQIVVDGRIWHPSQHGPLEHSHTGPASTAASWDEASAIDASGVDESIEAAASVAAS